MRGKVVLGLALIVILFVQSGSGQTSLAVWKEYPSNPVFDPATQAYYPTVVYDANAFFGHGAGYFYKMWYDSPTPIMVAGSNDGVSWTILGTTTGLTNARHARVIYNPAGFGGGTFYKIWYWDSVVSIYSVSAMRYAESADGLAWTNDQAVTQNPASPIVTGTWPNWNAGTYGPMHVLYNPAASNAGTDPFDHSYAMYYDGTTGGTEEVGLAYSSNGTYWSLASKVLSLGPSGSWDGQYACFGTVLFFEGAWHMWYSGGSTGGMGTSGIGYATSPDGIAWTKHASNPLSSLGGFGAFGGLGAPGAWNDRRNYAPMVLYDASKFSGHGEACEFKMWRSGVALSPSNYSIGYASLCLPPGTPPRVRRPVPAPLQPLARTQLGKAEEMGDEAANLLTRASEKNLDTAACESHYRKGLDLLERARRFYEGENWMAANDFALSALKEFRRAIDCLKALLGT